MSERPDWPEHPPLSPAEIELVEKLMREGRLRLIGLPVDTLKEMYELESDFYRIVRRIKLMDELVRLAR